MDKSKLFSKILGIKDILIFLAFMVVAAFPIGSMGGAGVESAYKVIYLYLFNSSNNSLTVLFLYSLFFILLAVGHLTFLKCYSSPKISLFVTRLVCLSVIYISLISTSSVNLKFFGLTSSTVTLIIIAFIIDFACAVAEFIVNFRANKLQRVDVVRERQTDQTQADGAVTDNGQVEAGQVTDAVQEQTEAVQKKTRKRLWGRTYSNIVFAALGFIVLNLYFFPTKLDNQFYFDFYSYRYAVNCELSENYFGVEEINVENFVANFREGKVHKFNYCSTNYTYWQNKIDEKKDEIGRLMPDSASESDLKKYKDKIEKLQEEIKIINEHLASLKYEKIEVVAVERLDTEYDGYITSNTYRCAVEQVIYDTQCNSGSQSAIKWDNKQNKRLFCNQSIKLDKLEFPENTDFSSVKIGATITYYDGSIKKSYITPANYQELNGSPKGKHKIEWSDSWGSYEYEISII